MARRERAKKSRTGCAEATVTAGVDRSERLEALASGLQQQLNTLLAALFDEGCFAGTTAQDSWFVNVASGALLSAQADSGQLIVEVGVAPSEPIEYIVVRVAVQAEGTIMTTVSTGPAAISHA